MKILITICARGGSKGIPGKNIREIGGKPLVAYSIEIAKEFLTGIDGDLALSTDDQNIKDVAKKYGLETNYVRPDILATDQAGKIDTIKHLLLFTEETTNRRYDYILDLDVTSPLRNLQDIRAAFEILTNNESALNIFSVNKANRNPYFNMVEKKENGYYNLIKELPNSLVMARQSAPEVFDMNASFYWYRRSFFEENYRSAVTDKSLVYVMNHICFDLDHLIDFEFMEYLFVQDRIKSIL